METKQQKMQAKVKVLRNTGGLLSGLLNFFVFSYIDGRDNFRRTYNVSNMKCEREVSNEHASLMQGQR